VALPGCQRTTTTGGGDWDGSAGATAWAVSYGGAGCTAATSAFSLAASLLHLLLRRTICASLISSAVAACLLWRHFAPGNHYVRDGIRRHCSRAALSAALRCFLLCSRHGRKTNGTARRGAARALNWLLPGCCVAGTFSNRGARDGLCVHDRVQSYHARGPLAGRS